ncbi:XRCC4-like factor-domain-containing protein [Endogone sp. FLAS-F59071]|nr:XRCC4-like factor-domain-containing protein [Endogone sp. FLAS-F59071]|eukprot:RUS19760.1 XRCC4-like factor-domain-containing protein [Endogone sp. FLAS-F59071]
MSNYFTNSQNQRLRSSSWVTLNLANSPYMVKSAFGSDSYLVMITNLRQVWVEDLDSAQIRRKAKQYQSALEPSDPEQMENLLAVLSEFFKTQKKDATYQLESEDDEFKLQCTTSLEWATLMWTFTCHVIPHGLPDADFTSLDADSVLYTHFTLPLLMMATGYQKQHTALKEQLIAKDAEVAEAGELLESAGILTSPRQFTPRPLDLLQNVLQSLDEPMGLLYIFDQPITTPLLRAATEALVPLPDDRRSSSPLSHAAEPALSDAAQSAEPLTGSPEKRKANVGEQGGESEAARPREKSALPEVQREELDRREALKEKLAKEKEQLAKKKKKKLF